MVEELPKQFNLIVVGTGFPESCIAAAASRIGKSVLHIDPNEYYGGPWASFNLDMLNVLLDKSSNGVNREIMNATYKWHIPIDNNDELSIDDNESTCINTGTDTYKCVKELIKSSRHFNIDLCPRILYSCGDLVHLLITSNICRYAEFRACDNIWTFHNNELLNVPCSRSDVFNSKDLTIIEKRLLMKFLNQCLTYNVTDEILNVDTLENQSKTFGEYIRDQKLTKKISDCILQAIAMVTEETSCKEGVIRTKKFLQSLGRYTNTPFIFPMYGCGELPQCFCRLCAVFGGIYCLKKQVTKIEVKNNGNKVFVEVDGQHSVETDYIVVSPSNVLEQFKDNIQSKNVLSRGIILTTTPLSRCGTNDGGVSLLRLVLSHNKREAYCIQLSHQSGTCPKGVYIFHLITPAISDEPCKDLQPFHEQIFNTANVNFQILYTAYFTIVGYDFRIDTSGRIFGTMPPSFELDYDQAIENGHSIFKKIYGDNVEFLPRAPDPEEIIIDGEDPQELYVNKLPEDLRVHLQGLSISEEVVMNDEGENTQVNNIDIMEQD